MSDFGSDLEGHRWRGCGFGRGFFDDGGELGVIRRRDGRDGHILFRHLACFDGFGRAAVGRSWRTAGACTLLDNRSRMVRVQTTSSLLGDVIEEMRLCRCVLSRMLATRGRRVEVV